MAYYSSFFIWSLKWSDHLIVLQNVKPMRMSNESVKQLSLEIPRGQIITSEPVVSLLACLDNWQVWSGTGRQEKLAPGAAQCL